jgi:hypothetical protein
VSSLEAYLDHGPVHVSFSGTCEGMRALSDVLQRELGDAIRPLLTLYPKLDFGLLDVLHPLASKGAGVAAVAAEHGLSPDEVMAVGDNLNDLEMLEYAGTAVCMGNAEESLLAREHFLRTSANDADGAAEAIERFVLNDK